MSHDKYLNVEAKLNAGLEPGLAGTEDLVRTAMPCISIHFRAGTLQGLARVVSLGGRA